MTEQKVFISYTKGDLPLVQSALRWLRGSDLRSAEIDDPFNWSIRGEDVRSIIRDKIQQADTVVLVWSESAAKSAWVWYEVGMAQALGVPIRVLSAGDSRTKLPAGLAESEVVRLEPVKTEADAPAA
jgi:hypothetical protein